VSAYSSGKYSFEGRAAILEFLETSLGRDTILSSHQVHHPEIELTSPTSARGSWYLEDRVINPGPDQPEMPGHSILTGAAFYSDEYVKIHGSWKISLTGYERTYMEIRKHEPPSSFFSRWQA